MSGKKKIYFGLLFLTTMLVVSGFASGFFHNEPRLAPFNASVVIQSEAPTIPIVVNVTDDFGSSPVDTVDVTEGGISNAYVIFMADDSNSNANLPSGASIPGDGIGVGQIDITLQKPAGVRPFRTVQIPGQTCDEINCDPNFCGVAGIGSGNAANQRMYRCTIPGMQFYYEPRIDWYVNVSITDLSGSQSAYNDTKQFEYLPHPAINNTGNIAWTTVDVTATDQGADTDLIMQNQGNTVHTSVGVTGYNLTGVSYPGLLSYIPTNTFRSDGVDVFQCSPSATTMTENLEANVDGFTLNYGTDASPNPTTDLFFCIFPQLDLEPFIQLVDDVYRANGTDYAGAGTRTWELTNVG